MPALSLEHSNALLDASLGTSPLVPTVTPLRCRLMVRTGDADDVGVELGQPVPTVTTNPDGTTTSDPGAPTDTMGYTPGPGAPEVAFNPAVAQQAISAIAIVVQNMPGAQITGIELWDSADPPGRKWWGNLLAPKLTNPGDTFTIAAGSLTASMA